MFLAVDDLALLHDGVRHGHLGGSPSEHHAGVLHRLVQDGERVVQRPLGLVQDVRGSAAEHDRARLVLGAAGELDDLVLADHHLGNLFAAAQLRLLRVVEGRDDVRAEHRREAFGAVEVRMLDGHDAGLFEQLLRVVVDQLAVNENIATVLDNAVDLALHLLLLRLLDLSNRLERVDLHAGAVNLDLVCVHLAIRHQHLAILDDLRHADADLLLEDEALLEEGILQGGAGLFDHLDVVQVVLAVQPEHRVDGQGRKVILLVLQQLRAQGGPRDAQEVLPERLGVLAVVDGQGLELGAGRGQGNPVPFDDDLRVHPLLDELLGVPQQLCCQHHDGSSPIAAFVILCLRDVDQDLGRGIVDPDSLQDGGSVVRHRRRTS
mmetsp:Transcript_35657/g.70928  ORF Transcript_35657/g.70928 Transcript_35657/m.70928 type:complete len:377 (+) Transcript_35657:433-1563(+)